MTFKTRRSFFRICAVLLTIVLTFASISIPTVAHDRENSGAESASAVNPRSDLLYVPSAEGKNSKTLMSDEEAVWRERLIQNGIDPDSPSAKNIDESSLKPFVAPPAVIEDGVYAIKNIGNSNSSKALYMDTALGHWLPGYHMQQYAYNIDSDSSTPESPCDDFEVSALFKITRVESTGSYIIRIMRNNALSFDICTNSDTGQLEVLTKYIPVADSSVPISDTYKIEASSNGYFILKYGTTRYLQANNTTASGAAGAPDSYLTIAQGYTQVSDQSRWNFIKYEVDENSHKESFELIGIGSLEAGKTSTLTPIFYSTRIGYNMPVYSLSSIPGESYDIPSDNLDIGIFDIHFYHSGSWRIYVYLSDGSNIIRPAIASIPINVGLPFKEGGYFFCNARDYKYAQINNTDNMNLVGEIIELHKFNGYYYQRWNVIHYYDGYYKIVSQYSGLELTAPTGANNDIVTQTTTSSANTHLWKFIRQSNGTYRISPQSNSNYYLAAGDISSRADQDLEIRTVQTDNGDKWWSMKLDGTDGVFVGITSSNHDHSTAFGLAAPAMKQSNCNDFDYVITDSMTVSAAQRRLSNSKIFITRSHGSSDTAGTFISLGGYYLGTSQIYNYTTNSPVIDLKDCDLAIFIACKTANHETQSMVHAAVAAGANIAIGFTDQIDCNGANEWLERFSELLMEGKTVLEAAESAKYDCRKYGGITSMKIIFK